MKTSTTQQNEDTPKTTQKSTKKTKSRAKSTKESQNLGSTVKNVTPTSGALTTQQQQNNTTNQLNLIATTPTSSLASGVGVGNHHKSYAGLEPRSIKIIWEQHDQSDIELSAEVCSRVAEDASYKLWELINNIKTYSRHSGGAITYDLVNEVLKDSDVPPCLGAMDSDYDRIDYDGSYFFYSDKILELRDEYQKDVSFNMASGPDFKCSWPVEEKHMENFKRYVPSLINVAINGNTDDLDTALTEAALSPLIGSCYRLILTKIIQIIAFKQSNDISSRCWRLLRALSSNPRTRDVDCREEYYHLSEILVCQLLAPLESIKIQNNNSMKDDECPDHQTVKMEMDTAVPFGGTNELSSIVDQTMEVSTVDQDTSEKIFKLEPDSDEEVMNVYDGNSGNMQSSQYFASPVEWEFVNELCETLGMLGALNGYFQSECLYHIIRRLKRFFKGRIIQKERDYNYISRAVRGLTALGEYAFREFIPFIYRLNLEDIPETIWVDFNISAVFLHSHDDIFLYEWLQDVCGADKLQPFLTNYAQYYDKFLRYRYTKCKQPTFKLNPKVGVRRLEWNTLAAAMCHGDDPNKALKPKPSMNDLFPELKSINMKLNRAGNIRFKFAGCRPVILKSKQPIGDNIQTSDNGFSPNDILIAKRKLFKPLTNEKSKIPLCSYYFLKI
ncbi:SAGA factor-like TAF6 isoform X2 [Haematobia irritans]|uniref:SAGA factor-like TAF6 isoform X2 n=1 Tax=Haematobia irritans TaxID=7368 RepID=UPI003F50663B